MRKIAVIIILCLFAAVGYAQEVKECSFAWDGVTRQYICIIPSCCNESQPRGMILILHGLGDDKNGFAAALNAKSFAESSGWVCVIPQALSSEIKVMGYTIPLGSCWNAAVSINIMGSDYVLNGNTDDEGFLMSLLDTMTKNYNISTDSVFVTGFSMGGFMTQRLLVEHGDKFAAAVSVSGMLPAAYKQTMPSYNRHPNVMHVHSPDDNTVLYNGQFDYSDINMKFQVGLSVPQTIEYWRSFNQCRDSYVTDTFPDTRDDGLLFVRKSYHDGIDNSRVVLIDVEGGVHTWYGDTNAYDIDYMEEIYNFCTDKKQSLCVHEANTMPFSVYPNPAKDGITVYASGSVSIFNAEGQLIKTLKCINLKCGSKVQKLIIK